MAHMVGDRLRSTNQLIQMEISKDKGFSRMSPDRDFEAKERERKVRRWAFHLIFAILVLISGGFLIWKLSGLIAPIVVGALFAFLFRPIKDRFKGIPWLPHELQVLCSFAAIGLVLFFAFNTARQYIPDDNQQLEYKIRLKYKLNEKYQQLVTKSPKENPSMLMSFIQKQTGPLMDKVNQLLELDRKETEQFLHNRSGHFGGDNKILGYFEANNNTRKYAAPDDAPAAAPATTVTVAAPVEPPAAPEGSSWEPWILAPLIFIFLGFDNGQIRRYFISLVPNRYFELSLTLLDRLDNAIGKYLRGTLMECTLVGLTLCLGLILLGAPIGIATAIGIVCGLLTAIPMLGTVIALVICLGYALIAENLEPLIPGLDPNNLPLYVLILVGITRVLDDVVFQPFVLGSAVNIHPLVVVVAIIGGSLIMGLWGMLFAIPTVVVVKTVVETLFKELKDYRII
jgi:predicted PurR-regulated permease PerM